MKNRILIWQLAISITSIFILFSCNDASNKIKKNTPSSTTLKTNENIEKSNTSISAQIVDDSGNAAFQWMNDEGTVWNFGTIIQGDEPEYTFKFKNTGNEPMIISNAKGSCGCTVPQWPKEPIAPGATGEINVKFSSKNKKGSQNKTVTLTANTTPPTTKLRVTGQIEVTE